MKKLNLLLTTPILAVAPITSCLATTSCGNAIKIEVSESEYIEFSTESLKKDESCTITLSIRKDYVGAKFLPTSLDTIVVGDELVSEYDTYERQNYFIYLPNESYSQAKVYIRNVSGNIKISPKLESLNGISVTMRDLLEEIAYFDVGEKFSDDNIYVFANISNDEKTFIDDYTISCAWEVGHVFTQEDIGKTNEATITYTKGNAVYTAKYKVTCVEKTVAKFNGQRYGSIKEAIDVFNQLQNSGDYLLRIMPGTYVFDEALTIEQNFDDKNLIIAPNNLEDNDVILQGKITKAGSSGDEVTNSVFDIDGALGAKKGSITFSRLKFASPQIAAGITPTEYNYFNVINCLTGLSCGAHDINVVGCEFNGNKGKLVTALYTNATETTSHIIMDGCTGNDINVFFEGALIADSELEYDDYDLYINGCNGNNMLSLAHILGDDLTCRISECTGTYMYAASGAKSVIDTIISITGYGKYEIALCKLEQIAEGSATQNAFIKVNSTSAIKNKQLFVSSVFTKCSEEATNKIAHLYNAASSGEPWAYSYILDIGVLNPEEAIDLY